MKKLNELKKNKKGFTLMEMIVVIVIIGILLAILVPGILRWIDKAKDKQILVNAHTAYTAVAGRAIELYGAPDFVDKGNASKTLTDAVVAEYATLKAAYSYSGEVSDLTIDAKGNVTGMKYTEAGKSVSVTTDDTLGKTSWGEVE